MRRPYKKHIVDSSNYEVVVTDQIAWINRFVEYGQFGHLINEMWLIMLPNWEYVDCPSNYHMVPTWCQKWVSLNTVTGEWGQGGFPVQD